MEIYVEINGIAEEGTRRIIARCYKQLRRGTTGKIYLYCTPFMTQSEVSMACSGVSGMIAYTDLNISSDL